MSDHYATSTITEAEMQKPSKVTLKEIFDKTDYIVVELRQLNGNWCLINNQTCAEEMFTVFTSTIEKRIVAMCTQENIFY